VALVRTDVSDGCIASIIRVEGISELGTMLALTHSSEMSVLKRATRCYIPEDGILHSHHHETLKSYIIKICLIETSSKIHIGMHLSNSFPIQDVLRQRFFGFALEYVIRMAQENQVVSEIKMYTLAAGLR
jgi:hypothetical protein